ncbi:hypothetical protein K439DRAFT_1620958 [Ramaria rubella]|nr:hypothetical protein K439DRAFT_1620958 [Ramaria rubella]
MTGASALSTIGDGLTQLADVQTDSSQHQATQVHLQFDQVCVQADHTRVIGEKLRIQEHLQDKANDIQMLELQCSPEGHFSSALKIMHMEHELTTEQKLTLCEEFRWDTSLATMFCEMLPNVRQLWIAHSLQNLGFTV